jgi:hypothetical protein
VADSTLQNLASDYLTIQRVASRSDAIAINAYMPPEYDPGDISDLDRIAGNIVYMDLSGLPLGEELSRLGLPVLVLVVVEAGRVASVDKHPNSERPEHFHILEAGRISEGLQQVRLK